MQSFTDRVELKPGRLVDVGPARLAVRQISTAPPWVELAVVDEDRSERNFTLAPRATFPVGEETWRVGPVVWTSPNDWQVTVEHVDPAAALKGGAVDAPADWVVRPGAEPVVLRPLGSADERQLQLAEAALKRSLPHVYRRWLAATNGALPPADVQVHDQPFTLTRYQPLLGIHPGDPTLDLIAGDAVRARYLTDEFVVIAEPSGGLLAVKVAGPELDSIWFLPEREMAGAAQQYREAGFAAPQEYLAGRRLRLVAEDFDEFLGRLEPVRAGDAAG